MITSRSSSPRSSRASKSPRSESDALTLVDTLRALEVDVQKLWHGRRYEDARTRHAALEGDNDLGALVASLAPSSSLGVVERSAKVSAIVAENQLAPHTLWTSLLLVAFEPMLVRLRMRACRHASADVDQRVLTAFLVAVRRVRPGPYVLLALRRATAGVLFDETRADRSESKHAVFDDDRHGADVFGVDAANKATAAEVVRIIEAEGGDELRDALLATRAGDESLRAYVERVHARAAPSERASIYQRLVRARGAVESELRVRLTSTPTASLRSLSAPAA